MDLTPGFIKMEEPNPEFIDISELACSQNLINQSDSQLLSILSAPGNIFDNFVNCQQESKPSESRQPCDFLPSDGSSPWATLQNENKLSGPKGDNNNEGNISEDAKENHERKFLCQICNAGFRKLVTLKQHATVHFTVRPFTCEKCNKSFSRKSSLKSHENIHGGIKPHKCPKCHMAFHQKGNLVNHIYTHTNERPYKCKVCGLGFNQRSNLTNHQIKAHSLYKSAATLDFKPQKRIVEDKKNIVATKANNKKKKENRFYNSGSTFGLQYQNRIDKEMSQPKILEPHIFCKSGPTWDFELPRFITERSEKKFISRPNILKPGGVLFENEPRKNFYISSFKNQTD